MSSAGEVLMINLIPLPWESVPSYVGQGANKLRRLIKTY